MKNLRPALLWLFVINSGIAFGAGLYEAAVELPHWIVRTAGGVEWNAAAAQAANSGFRFWVFVTTIPLTLLTLANLGAAWKTQGELRKWWMTALLICVVERVLTFTFFIPTMIQLLGAGVTMDPEVVSTALLWERMNYVRHLLAAASWLSALKALTLLPR